MWSVPGPPSWPAALQPLALVVSPRLGLWHFQLKLWIFGTPAWRNVILKVGVHLGIIGFNFLHYPPLLIVCFIFKHFILASCSLHFTFSCKPNVRVMTSHFFPCHIWWWMDIFITRDDFWTLMDVVIVVSTRINMAQRASTTTWHATMMVVQKKTQSYAKWTSNNDFIPLVIKTYGCLHFCFDSFFITCVQITIARH
jgi:hypothetical protein